MHLKQFVLIFTSFVASYQPQILILPTPKPNDIDLW